MRSVFVLIVAILAWQFAAVAQIETVTATEAHNLQSQNGAILIDVRTPGEWKRDGMPAGSIGISIAETDFVSRVRNIVGGDLDRQVILICQTGVRSSHAARLLEQNGFRNLSNVQEGIRGSWRAGPGWIKKGLPMRPFSSE